MGITSAVFIHPAAFFGSISLCAVDVFHRLSMLGGGAWESNEVLPLDTFLAQDIFVDAGRCREIILARAARAEELQRDLFPPSNSSNLQSLDNRPLRLSSTSNHPLPNGGVRVTNDHTLSLFPMISELFTLRKPPMQMQHKAVSVFHEYNFLEFFAGCVRGSSDRARLLSLCGPLASSWLTASPASPKGQFNNAEWRTLVLVRLGVPLPEVSFGLQCGCGDVVDRHGHHLLSCSTGGELTRILHNGMEACWRQVDHQESRAAGAGRCRIEKTPSTTFFLLPLPRPIDRRGWIL